MGEIDDLKEVTLKNSSELIYKSNILANSIYDITLVQARFIAFVSSMIDKRDEDFFTYQINTNYVLDFLNIDRANINWLSLTLKKLQTTLIALRNDDSVEEYVTFFSWFKLDKKNDVIEFRFDRALKQHYINLKNNFTTLERDKYLKFDSIYTIRFYEYIKFNFQLYKQYNNKAFKEFIINISDLQQQFCSKYNSKTGKFEVIKSYIQYKDFKKRVLEVAKKELATNDLFFEYTEIKKGKLVEKIKIVIEQSEEAKIKEFKERKKALLSKSKAHKDIAKEQIKRIMSRNTDSIKDKLKYEQKLYKMFLKNTLKFDKDLQVLIDALDKEIYDNI